MLPKRDYSVRAGGSELLRGVALLPRLERRGMSGLSRALYRLDEPRAKSDKPPPRSRVMCARREDCWASATLTRVSLSAN